MRKTANSKTKPITMIVAQFALTIAIIAAIITASFAWFSASQPTVSANDGSFTAAEQPKDTTGSAHLISALGQYKGETGLGGYDDANAPFFLELELSTPPITVHSEDRPLLSYLSVKSISFTMSQTVLNEDGESSRTEYYPQLTGVKINRNGNSILSCGKEDVGETTYSIGNNSYTKEEIINGFCWRIALLYEPYSKAKENDRVKLENPVYYSPDNFSYTIVNNTMGNDPIIKSIYKETDVVLVFSARLYFLSSIDMNNNTPQNRNPFIFSGYDKTKGKYVDYSFMNTSFSFDYDFKYPSCVIDI